MTDQNSPDAREADSIGEATSRIVELEAELEAAGETTTAEEALADLKRVLHDWVDTVTAVVSTPGMGRVVLIHRNGRESRISSPELPMQLSKPAKFTAQD